MITPLANGYLQSPPLSAFAFMAERLQGVINQDGEISLSLWGTGDLGSVKVKDLSSEWSTAPNYLASGDTEIFIAKSKPVILLTKASFISFKASETRATWDTIGGGSAIESTEDSIRVFSLQWGAVLIKELSDDLMIACGATMDEAKAALKLNSSEIKDECLNYIKECDKFAEAEPLVRSMVMQGVHAALSSIRYGVNGNFAGLAAGIHYSAPARTYFRDGYYTTKALLLLKPEIVKDEIDLLALGIKANGECPSGVITNDENMAKAWNEAVKLNVKSDIQCNNPLDWWSDHFDSPLFFILMVRDYVNTTHDESPITKYWDKMKVIMERYIGFIVDESGLPQKPRNDRDWADNVFRFGYVAFDLGLYFGALRAFIEWTKKLAPNLTAKFEEKLNLGLSNLEKYTLVNDTYFADYGNIRNVSDSFVERHLTIDSITLLQYDAVGEERAHKVLDKMQKTLETRHNHKQQYGDWGVMCCYPSYERAKDLRDKSSYALRYHNGSDWPFLDGLYGEQLIRYQNRINSNTSDTNTNSDKSSNSNQRDFKYALLRWWEYGLCQGWPSPVEYFTPPYGRGSILQAWSSYPAAVVLEHKDLFMPKT